MGFLLTPPGQPTFLSASSKLHVATQATCSRCVHPRVEIVSQPFPEQEYCLCGSHGLLSDKARAWPTGGAPKTLVEGAHSAMRQHTLQEASKKCEKNKVIISKLSDGA